MNQSQRTASISQHLTVSTPFSEAASSINDEMQMQLAQISDLEPTEQGRLLSALAAQINCRLALIHGNR